MLTLKSMSGLHFVAHRTFACGRRWGDPVGCVRSAMPDTDIMARSLFIATRFPTACECGTD